LIEEKTVPIKRFALGIEFPYEGFVQHAIEAHFRSEGFDIASVPHVDLSCSHAQTGEVWHIEAKGKTSQVGLDFRTCLGQLVQRMSRPEVRHGIAIPDIEAYRAQTAKVSVWVVEQLGLHWLFVSADGSVEVVRPSGASSTSMGNKTREKDLGASVAPRSGR
jgi:hypothetical protein